jgi:hypothetical protein
MEDLKRITKRTEERTKENSKENGRRNKTCLRSKRCDKRERKSGQK